MFIICVWSQAKCSVYEGGGEEEGEGSILVSWSLYTLYSQQTRLPGNNFNSWNMEESQLSEGNRKVFDEKKLIDNKDMSAHTDLTIGDLKLQGNDKI